MGASSSNNGGIRPSTSISTSEREAEVSLYSEDSLSANDERQRAYVGASARKGEDQPRSQGPSPYATLRTSEFWSQRPSAPPTRETSSTCDAQVTGWQSTDGHDPVTMCQQNNEVMELSRIISHLAVANRQLVSAHSATLVRMESLYSELSKDREDRKRKISTETLEDTREDALHKRLRDVEQSVEREETRRLERRVVKLENFLTSCSVGQCKQRGLREDGKLRFRIERLENLLKVRDTTKDDDRLKFAESCRESTERQTSHFVIDPVIGEVSRVTDDCDDEDRGATTERTDNDRCRGAHSDDFDMSLPTVENEDLRSANVDLDKIRRRRGRLRDDEQNSTTRDPSEEIHRLLKEIGRLKAERLQGQNANERLLCSLADQKDLVKKLSVDYEELKARYATVEVELHERRQQYDELTKHMDSAKKENERLLRETDVFQLEKDTADTRIAILEQELQKSLLEKEQIRNAENQKTSKLRAQLSEEVSDKKKQIMALENALREIQRLKETVKTEKKDENDIASKEDDDSMDDTSEGISNSVCAAVSMDEFKKELTLKREVRHRAIAAVSSEMERLRRELDAEREAHSETSSMLALLRSANNNSRDVELANDALIKTTMKERENSDESEKELRRAEAQRLTYILKVSDELRSDVRYQMEKVDDLRYHLETDSERHRRRIQCLTEVSSKTRESLVARERRTNELKDHLAQVLVRLGDRAFLEIQDDAGAECDRQLENINALKGLYNARLRILTELRDSATKELTDVKQKLEYSLKKTANLEEELKKTEEKVDAQDSEITNLESQLGLTKADCRDLQNQMSLINGLFTQMLLGASSADMDLDRLTQLLQENHDLISDMAREESTEAAALPKLLLDLVEQVEGGKGSQRHASEENNVESVGEIDRKEDDLQEEDIANNLPKVWRVLLELLSCHAVTSPSVSVASCSDPNSCYKSVDTPAGPRLVISVSKTYIRLKELILEKKHLEKEMNRMKQLNTHLESKLSEQEKRLSMVSAELTKTWSIVGRMQAQHQQLHTHEEILRYELQEKRKMLQELKQELEYCREKWESARQKNTNTELEWRNLRREFAARKALVAHDSFNSAESGFSDERGDDTDEEEEAIEGRIRHGPRRRTRKESPRAPTPDTESEQPTDTELSETKTSSSTTLEQRTPTPESEAEELDEAEEVARVDTESDNGTEIAHVVESTEETLDPLDQALTNVIQNLIRIDDGESDGSASAQLEGMRSFEDSCDDIALETDDNTGNDHAITSKADSCGGNPRVWTPSTESPCSLFTAKILKRTVTNIDLPSAVDDGESSSIVTKISSRQNDDDDGEITRSKSISTSSVSHAPVDNVTNTSDTMSIFSIGPLPAIAAPSSSIKSVQFSNPLIVGPSNRYFAPLFGAIAEGSKDLTDSSAVPLSTTSTCRENEPLEDKQERSSKPVESVTDSDSISVDSSSSTDTVREFPIAVPSAVTSFASDGELRESATNAQKEAAVSSTKSRTPEEVLATRADRLRRLEEQADWLVKKMNATSKRGTALCTRLEELHDAYGEPPVPPPMPDVLPNRRLPSSLADLSRQIADSQSVDGVDNNEDRNSDGAKEEASSSNTNAP